MKGKKLLACALSLCTCACAGAGSALLNRQVSAEPIQQNVSEIMTVSEGLNVEYNVSGQEKNSSLTKDTRKGIHFSSKEKGNAAEGESVAFLNVLSGRFETDFRVYTENANTDSTWWEGGAWYTRNNAEEVREFAITLTDEDKDESFTLYIKGGTPWNSRSVNARVAYGDVGENFGTGQQFGEGSTNADNDWVTSVVESGLRSTEYNTSLRGTSFTNNFLHSTVVGFDPITKEVYGYSYESSSDESKYDDRLNKRVILDLDNPEHLAFAGDKAGVLLDCNFDNYTVKYTLTDVTGADEDGSQEKDEEAKFILYSINGQSLAGENGVLTENAAAGLKVQIAGTAQKGKGFNLPMPTLRNFFGETPVFTGNVKVVAPSGRVVLSERAYKAGYSFTPSEEGTYQVIYSGVKDNSGNVLKAFTANGTYTGAEVVYSYPVVVEKSMAQTAEGKSLLSASGLNVEYNVAGVEKNADLARDVQKGVYFSTKEKGKAAEGSYVTFKNELVGTMELDFRVFTDKKNECPTAFQGGDWATNNDAEELKEIAITVTDSKTGEKFTVYIKGGTSWSANTPDARVAYGDVGEYYGSGYWYVSGNTNTDEFYKSNDKGLSSGEYNTSLRGTTFTNASKNSDFDFKSGYTTNIGFDPQTKQVYGYIYGSGAYAVHKRVILDLDDQEDLVYAMKPSRLLAPTDVVPEAFKESTFEKYTIKVTVTEVADVEKALDENGETIEVGEAKQAKFIIYNVNGQSLAGERGKLKSNSGYGAYVAQKPVAYVGLEATLPKPTLAGSVLEGVKEFSGTVKVVDEKGGVVLAEQTYSSSVIFTPQKAGKYFALYGGMQDTNGCLRGTFSRSGYSATQGYTSVEFTVEEPIVLPENSLSMRNTPTWIGAKKAADDLTVLLTIKKDGVVCGEMNEVEIDEHFVYTFTADGEYELIYLVKAPSGTQNEIVRYIEVAAMRGVIVRPDSLVVYGEEFAFSSADFNLHYCDQGQITDFSVKAEVFDGEMWREVVSQEGVIQFKETFITLGEGEWQVRFTLLKGEDFLVLERTFTVLDMKAPILSADSLPDTFFSVDTFDGVQNFIVKKGETAQVPACEAQDDKDGDIAVEILLKKPSDTKGIAVVASTEIVFDQDGKYMIVYRATDAAGNYSTIAYVIDVRQEWFSVSADDATVELGSSFTPNTAIVYDEFEKTAAQDYTLTITVLFGGVVVDSDEGAFTPTSIGVYEVLYVAQKNGLQYSYTSKLTVVDTTAPDIIVDGEYASRANVGDTIEILYAFGDDFSPCDVTVSVTRDGSSKITISESGTFTVDKAGRYVVKYTVTDVSGNSASVEFIIDVLSEKQPSKKSCGSNAGFGTYAALSMIALGLAAFKLFKRKTNKKI